MDVEGSNDDGWRPVVAVGLVGDDLTVQGLTRLTGLDVDRVTEALRAAGEAGVLVDGEVVGDHGPRLRALLGRERTAEVHAATALHLLGMGPDHHARAIDHARAAGTAVPQQRLVGAATTSGRMALAAGDHHRARALLEVAHEVDDGSDTAERARRLIDLAQASDGCGDVMGSRDHLAEAIRLAHTVGDGEVVVEAALRSARPPDWTAGDRRMSSLLDLAERYAAGTEREPAVLAARAMAEMRVPASTDGNQQIAWVTRGRVAQPLAERALADTEGRADADRLLALTAWRSTHRSPAFLAERLRASAEAVDLAQRLVQPDRLVDAAAMSAVDHLETGDRQGHDEALATIRWAATTDTDPRLRWWAETTASAAALLDGDVEAATRHRALADEIGGRHQLPGWVAAELLLAAETALDVGDEAELRNYLLPLKNPLLASPIVRATVAVVAARLGSEDVAVHHARVALRSFDQESSLLLCLVLAARAAAATREPELVRTCAARLEPWSGHVAVDASGWWCIGPVDLALAELAWADGRVHDVEAPLRAADATARACGDVRSLRRVDELRRRAATPPPGPRPTDRPSSEAAARVDQLTGREREVLALIARGHTNAVIAAVLAYSTSTIRADTVSIYRKLGVGGRAEAAALASAAGLVGETTTTEA